MWSKVRGLLRNEKGQALAEYALIIALVSVLVGVALAALGGGITGTLNNVLVSL